MKLAVFFLLAPLAAFASSEIATSSTHRFRVETVADGLDHPWAIAKLPDGDFLVTERSGHLLRIGKNGAKSVIDGVPPVMVEGQGGLLDVTLHPDYAKNGWIYLSYAKPLAGGSMTAVARTKLADNRLQDLEMVFDPPADQASDTGLHFGCRIVFDGLGHIFFSIGDRGGPTTPANLAQSLAARRLAGIGNRTLADWMGGRNEPAVTQAVKRLEARTRKDRKLAKFYAALEKEMSNVKM